MVRRLTQNTEFQTLNQAAPARSMARLTTPFGFKSTAAAAYRRYKRATSAFSSGK